MRKTTWRVRYQDLAARPSACRARPRERARYAGVVARHGLRAPGNKNTSLPQLGSAAAADGSAAAAGAAPPAVARRRSVGDVSRPAVPHAFLTWPAAPSRALTRHRLPAPLRGA